MEWFIVASWRLCACRWKKTYAGRVSGWFRGFPKIVSSAGIIGKLAAGRASTQNSLTGRAKVPEEAIIMKITRRSLLGAASATLATAMSGKPAGAAAEFEFKLGVNTPD